MDGGTFKFNPAVSPLNANYMISVLNDTDLDTPVISGVENLPNVAYTSTGRNQFSNTYAMTWANVNKLARFIHSYCEHEELPHLDKGAMARIIEYASRLAGNNKKISTNFNDISQIIGEAGTWAHLARAKVVTEEFIEKALQTERKMVLLKALNLVQFQRTL